MINESDTDPCLSQTPSSLASFILAMTLHPEIQTRAQAELRSLLGDTWQRLPSFEDRQNLPYVDAIVLELLRWNPSVPLGQFRSPLFGVCLCLDYIRPPGLAHRLAQGDVYRGYYFPKGTIVWANIWWASKHFFEWNLNVATDLSKVHVT